MPPRPPVMRKMSALMRRMTLSDPRRRKSRRTLSKVSQSVLKIYMKKAFLGAKQIAEKAMNDPMAMVNNVSSLKFW